MFDATCAYLHQHVCWGLAAHVFLLTFAVFKALSLTLVPISTFRESFLFQYINVPPCHSLSILVMTLLSSVNVSFTCICDKEVGDFSKMM